MGNIYISTLLPDIGYSGDTAKFQFLGHILGIPHATGYPFYMLATFLFSYVIPFGTLAYKINLFSAICSIAALFFFYHILQDLKIGQRLTVYTTLLFGITPSLWSQSIVAEVYTLHLLFVTSTVFLFLRWSRQPSSFYFYMACSIYALSFGHHLTMITLLPSIIYLVMVTQPKIFFDFRKIIAVLFIVLLSAMQYLYLFWRSHTHTLFLETSIPNWQTFWWYITGAQFKSNMFTFTFNEIFFQRLPMLIKITIKEMHVFILLAWVGLFQKTISLKKSIFLILIFLGNLFYALNYDIPDIWVYLIPNYFIIFVYVGIGFEKLFLLFRQQKKILCGLSMALFTICLWHGYCFIQKEVYANPTTQDAKQIKDVLSSVKGNAIILTDQYHKFYFLNYYLIGEQDSKKNIYAPMHHLNIELIKKYVIFNEPFYLENQRCFVPTGLEVYCIDKNLKKQLQSYHLSIIKLGNNFYKILRHQT